LPTVATNIIEGSVIGGVSGAATGAIQYGLTCSESSAGCSWSGLGHATETDAATGAIGGAAGGALATGIDAVTGGGRKSTSEDQDATSGCGTPPHSFTGSTRILMANGTTKPINKIKTGDKITNAVPGQPKTQTHTVQKVTVTHTDHDFVQLLIATTHQTRAPPADLTTSNNGHHAAAGTLTTTWHHPFYDITQGDPQSLLCWS
jgi:hypothetical protein